ncbi:MAG: EAL domain-containing protein, partial [Candidatus Izemoplasmataceae bacterium]
MGEKIIELMDRLLYPTPRFKVLLGILIVALFMVTWVLVYVTGGTRFGYLHVMYIPVILAAMVLGFKGGLSSGLVAGIILGPLMPLNTETMEAQSIDSWVLRMVFFMMSGGLVGFIINTIRLKNEELTDLYTHDLSTGIETMNSHWLHHSKSEKRKDRVAISLHINNYDSLVVLLGMDEYSTLLKNIHKRLKEFLPDHTLVYLIDRRLFWIDASLEAFNAIRDDFSEQMEKETIYSETVPLFLDFSIGVAIPEKPMTMTERFKKSDISALHAKNNGMNFEIYHDDLARSELFLKRLAALPGALDNNEFFLVYQPILSVKDDKVIGIEALIRWKREDEILTPEQFIPMAEETKLIDHITEWVLDEALNDYKTFKASMPALEMAVNVSYRNLFNPRLIERMVKRIKASDLEPDRLHIEMTESTLMRNRISTQAFLSSFRKLGVATILDDFGTGYSSLSCLRDLPVDIVKIDREFTMNIHEDRSMFDMIATIIDLSHKMDLKVIAEGVEEKAILDEIKRLKCDYVQGY